MWGDREGTELAKDVESLLRVFMNVTDMLFKGKFTVKCESEVFEVMNKFNCFAVYSGRSQVRDARVGVDE